MTLAGAFALGFGEVAFSSPPPNWPKRRSEKRPGRESLVGGLLRTIRRELAGAAEAPVTAWLPRITSHYPH